MQQEPLDLLAIIAVLLTFIVSKDVASALSPYAAIVMLSCAGACLALSGAEEKMSMWKAVFFVALRVILAVAITVSVAEILQNIIPWLKPRYSLSPIALGIGWIRDFNQVRDWLGRLADRLATKKIDG